MVVLAILLLAIAIYGHTLDAPLVFDDVANIKKNVHVQMESFSWSQLQAAAWQSRDNDRPLAYISFALTHWAFGGDVAGQHLVNISIHVINGVLVYLLALMTLRRLAAIGQQAGRELWFGWTALAAALLFVAHPLQTQAVTYTVQRMTSMATMFYLAALLGYVWGRLSPSRPARWGLWLAALFAWACALGSKQIAATLPLMVLLYEWYFFQDLSWSWLRRTLKVGGLAAAIATVAVAMFFLDADLWNRLERGYALRDFTLGERLLTQPRVVAEYISLVLYPAPHRLNLLHSVETSRTLFDPAGTILAIALIVGLLTLAIVAARRHRLLSFALLWFFIHLVIESTVLPLEMMYEHRVYLPMVGPVLLVAGLAALLVGRRSRSSLRPRKGVGQRTGIALVAMLIVLLAYAARTRNHVWTDPVRLWTDVLEKNSGKFPAAIVQRSRAYNNRGNLFAFRGEYDLAIADFGQAIRLDPSDAEALVNRGLSQEASGQYALAIEDFGRAIALGEQLGQNFPEAYLHRGRARAELGEFAAALEDYETATEQAPGLGEAYLGIAWIRATCPDAALRDSTLALSLSRAGCEATGWREASWLDSLACAYAAEGKFEAAIHWETKAAELTPEPFRGEYLERLRTFGEQQPYRSGQRNGA